MAGYSGTPLVKKLGLKDGMSAWIDGAPMTYSDLVEGIPSGVKIAKRAGKAHDFIHSFARSTRELRKQFPILKRALDQNGMLWISWPKGSSGVETDLNENIVRDLGLKSGLVDVKVCAVNETWSGLKFVYRLKDRV
jgi:hypothetical protein